MMPDTKAEFRCGRVVAFRETGDFYAELERDADVCWISHSHGRIRTLNNKGLQHAE
jgi:hypothetical protein